MIRYLLYLVLWNIILSIVSSRIVLSGKYARFSVLTPQLIRMEWNAQGHFYDGNTTFIVHRPMALRNMEISVALKENWTVVETEYLVLRHDKSSEDSFDERNLKVVVKNFESWFPGKVNEGQLNGTIRTLDGAYGEISLDCLKKGPGYIKDFHCTYGVVSKSGFAVLDDTFSTKLNNDVWPWINNDSSRVQLGRCSAENRRPCGMDVVSKEHCDVNGCCWDSSKSKDEFRCFYGSNADQDLYFMGHGHDYMKAMEDFTMIAGKIPIPPKKVFGNMLSRYWAYSDEDLKTQVVQRYQQHSIPLDVLVIDMDWHLTFYANASKDQAGQPKGWTGFTWNPKLFPNATAFLDWCHAQGMYVTLNVHPASGIQIWEDSYNDMAKAMNIKNGSYVPFQITSKKFVHNWMSITLAARETEGVDFWWLDWQQGENWIESKESLYNLSPTLWLNYVFFTNPYHWKKKMAVGSKSHARRPVILHRWGGLGNHRYQIGFSGDAQVAWESLAFQPKFTASAANVGYGYWSHDLGGHNKRSPPELFTRWVQWGAFSPIFRAHCTKDARSDRRIFKYEDKYYEIMRHFTLLRTSMLPYLYTEAKRTHDTGVSIVHPLYYHWPNYTESYDFGDQYMFGRSLLVAPIAKPVETNSLASKQVWLPPGDWFDLSNGQLFTGPQVVTFTATIKEMPIYAKAGALIPVRAMQENSIFGAGVLAQVDYKVVVVPGKKLSAYSMYDDDGESSEYLDNKLYMWQSFTAEVNSSSVLFTAAPTTGTYNGLKRTRTIVVEFLGIGPVIHGTINGKRISQCHPFDTNKINCWRYEGQTLSLQFYIVEAVPIDEPIAVEATIINSPVLRKGLVGKFRRLHDVKRLLDNQWDITTVYMNDYPTFMKVFNIDTRISYNPQMLLEDVKIVDSAIAQSIKEISLLKLSDPVKQEALALLGARGKFAASLNFVSIDMLLAMVSFVGFAFVMWHIQHHQMGYRPVSRNSWADGSGDKDFPVYDLAL